MRLISTLKRAKYLSAALVLLLAAMPVGPIANAFAEALATSVGTCDELTSALADDSTTINLTADLVGCTTATVSKGKTINGNGKSITFASNDGFYIDTNNAVAFKDLTITAAQMGVVVPETSTATRTNLTLDGVTINALYRGLSYYQDQDGASLTVKDSTIQNSGVTNYDTDWSDAAGHPAGTRGISFVEFKHSTADITNTTIQGFKYVVNLTQYTNTGSTFNLIGVTLKGWADLNMWQNNATINVKDSDLLGIMAHDDTTEWNNFGNIKFNSGTSDNELNLDNVRLKNAYPYATESGVAQQTMLIDYGSYNKVVMDDCDFDDTLPGRLGYAVWEAGAADITINSGTYDLPMEGAYMASGKVNYLVDGRYVVADAPEISDIPARVLVEAGVDTEISGLDGASLQEYGSFEANGGTFTKPNILNATRLSNSSDLFLNFDIYKVDETGATVKDESYNRTIKVHAYQANKISDVYMTKGSTKNDLELDFTSNQYTTMEVKTSDETIATIAKNDTDGKYTVNALEDGEVKILGKVSVSDLATDWIELGTVKVYSFSAESEVTIPVGAEIGLTDGVISKVGNPGVVDVELDSTDYATLSGATAEGALTATAAGTATLTFKVNDEMVGTTSVKVYDAKKPDDIVLSVNGVGADEWQRFTLSGTNLPSYALTIENRNIARVGEVRNAILIGNYCWTYSVSGNREKCINAESAGKTKATVTYRDSMDTSTTQDFYVHVSRYTESNNKPWYEFDSSYNYEVAPGDDVEFRLTEGYGQDSITLEGDDYGFAINNDASGNYTVTVPENTAGGTYTLKFVDTVAGKKIAERKITIKVHEIVTSEDEIFVKKGGDPVAVTAKEKNGYGDIGECRYVTIPIIGRIMYGCAITITDVSGGDASDDITIISKDNNEYDISVNKAGQYNVTFSDGTASKTIVVYGIDFSVEEQEYHIVKGDTNVDETKLVKALNRYWEETAKQDGVTGFKILKDTNTDYYVQWDGAEAGKYTVEFYAYAGPDRYDLQNREVRDTKTVDIYVYEMSTPDEDEYRGEIAKRLGETSYTFTGVDVDDKINATVPGMAKITAEVTYGDVSAVDLSEIADGKVTISKPGRYEVTYTDTMNKGKGGVVGTWTATFKVYCLDAVAPKGQIVNLAANGEYYYMINPSETYGLVRVTISKKGKHGKKTTVYQDETRYHGSGTPESESEIQTFTFNPAEYGEGEYTVKIRNLSAEDYGEVEEGSFYAVAREYDFVMVEQGEPVTITSGSSWKVDEAYENGNELTVVDGKTVNIDTTELPLGVHNVMLGHLFDGGPGGEDIFGAVKIVTVVVYKVVPSEDTSELNPGEVTVATVKDLYERAALATAGLIRDLVSAGVPEEVIYCSTVYLEEGCDPAWERLSLLDMFIGDHLALDDIANRYHLDEEQAAAINFNLIEEAAKKFKEAFGETGLNGNGLFTAAALNMVNSSIRQEEVAPLETEVKVTPLTSEEVDATEKADIENALSEAGIEVDNIDYYDVSVLMKMEGLTVGKLHKLNGKITVALTEVTDPASGYSRQYFVVRDHNGTVTVLEEGVDFYIEDGVLYVISDEFSTYAVAYKDTLLPVPKAPDTGDEVVAEGDTASVSLSTAIVLASAAITLAGAIVFAKRK